MSEPQTLDLDELTEPAGRFRYDAKWHDYARWNSFGLLAQKRMAREWRRVLMIEAADEPTEQEEAEHSELLRGLVVAATSMSAEEAQAMPIEKAGQAVLGFFIMRAGAQQEIGEKLGAQMKTMLEKQTGEPSSADSIESGRKKTRARG